MEFVDYLKFKNCLPTGHGWSLHEKVAEFDPGQSSPPLEGAGLLQSLVWDWFPPPQVTVQVDKALQSLQFPSEIHLSKWTINAVMQICKIISGSTYIGYFISYTYIGMGYKAKIPVKGSIKIW